MEKKIQDCKNPDFVKTKTKQRENDSGKEGFVFKPDSSPLSFLVTHVQLGGPQAGGGTGCGWQAEVRAPRCCAAWEALRGDRKCSQTFEEQTKD